LMGAYNTQQRANTAIANALAQKSSLEQMQQAELEDQMKESEQRQQKIKSEFDSTFKARTAELDGLSKQLASQDFTTGKVDANNFWNSRSTGQKILGALALGLGGVGSSLTGGPNYALEIINKAIDRDIDQQKFNIQHDLENKKLNYGKLKDQMNVGQTMLANFRQKYGDDLQAESAFRTLAIQRTQLKLQQIASQTDNKVVQENAKVLNSQLEREKQIYGLQMKQALAQQAQANQIGTGQKKWSELTPMEKSRFSKDEREQFERAEQITVDGLGPAFDPEAAKKAREIKGTSDNLISTIDQIIQLRNSTPAYDLANPASTNHKKLMALKGDLLGAKKAADTLGTLDKGVETLVDKIYSNPTGFNPAITKQYEYSKNMQIKKSQNLLAPYVGHSTAKRYTGPAQLTDGLKTITPRK
jgi:hypothetical protein